MDVLRKNRSFHVIAVAVGRQVLGVKDRPAVKCYLDSNVTVAGVAISY